MKTIILSLLIFNFSALSNLAIAGTGGYRSTCVEFNLDVAQALVTTCSPNPYNSTELVSHLYICGNDGYIESLDEIHACNVGEQYSLLAISTANSKNLTIILQ